VDGFPVGPGGHVVGAGSRVQDEDGGRFGDRCRSFLRNFGL